MKITIPTLGPDGYVTEPNGKLNYMFAHAFVVRYDDTNLYRKEAMSMQKVIADYGDNPDKYTAELQAQLTNYFSRVFTDVTVSVGYVTNEINSLYEATIDVVVKENGQKYSLGRSLTVDAISQTATVLEEINK